MKKSVVTIITIWLLYIGPANAFLGGFWDSTVDFFASAYDSASSIFVDSSDETTDEATEDYDTDDYNDSSWWSLDNWFGEDNEDPYALNSNSCAPAADSWCTVCSYGFDLLSDFFDDIEYTCNKDNFMAATEPNQSTADGQSASRPVLDQKSYCACLGTQEDFPAPGSMDIIKNIVHNKKTDMINQAFKQYQKIASDMAMLALNPDLVSNLSADSACLPGNFAKLESALFKAPKGQKAPCGESFKKKIQVSFEKQMNICKSKRCADNELIALRPSYDEYKAKVGALNSEELGGKDHSSLGSWIDFMMKDEFVENTLNRLNLDPSKKPSFGKILNQDFANIGFDFLSVVKSNHADMAITSRRTPAQTISKGLSHYLSSGMECSFDSGLGDHGDKVSCDEMARAIRQQADFSGAEGISSQDIVDGYIAQQFIDLMNMAPELKASLESRLREMKKAKKNNASSIERMESMAAQMSIFDKMGTSRAPSSSSEEEESAGSPASIFDMNLIFEALKEHYSNKSAAEIEAELNDTARAVNTLKSNELNKNCNQFIDEMANMCRMMGDGSFSASFFIGTVKSDEDGKSIADFSSIPDLAAAVAPSTNKEGKPMTVAEKKDAVADIEGILDQLTCYESNQLEGQIQPDEYLEDHPPMVAYVTDENGDGGASWMTCMKACTRSYEYQGEQRQIRYCHDEPVCPKDDEDPVRALVESALEREGLFVSDVRTDADVASIVVQEVENPGSTTSSNRDDGIFSEVDSDSYERTYSSPMSESIEDYYDSIARSSGAEPMSYNEFKAQNSGSQNSQNRDGNQSRNSSGSVSNSSSVINDNGTVDTPPVVDPINGQPVSSAGLESLNKSIKSNNSFIVDASNKIEQIDQQIKQVEGNGGEVDSALKTQLSELRAQIESLKDDNKKLAAERDAEVEKIQKARTERRQRIAAQNSIDESNVASSFTRSSAPVVSSSNSISTGPSESSVASTGSSLNGGPSNNSNAGSFAANDLSPVSDNSNVINASSAGSVRLSGTSTSGELVSFNSNDVIDFGARSDVTNYDAAVQIALKASKSVFVFKGKTYVKKGEEFIQVSNVQQERGIASEINEGSSVGELTDFNNQMIEKYSGVSGQASDSSQEVIIPKKIGPTVPAKDESGKVSRPGQQYDTESLWQYLQKAGGAVIDNLFTLPSK